MANGSFEDGPKGLGDFMTFHPESKVITGWIVTRASIDLIGLGRASNGQRSIDLHGSPGYGGIKQTFHTTAGQRYRVTFTLSCNPEAKFKTKRIAVEVAGTTETFTVDGSGTTWDKLRWDSARLRVQGEFRRHDHRVSHPREPRSHPRPDDRRRAGHSSAVTRRADALHRGSEGHTVQADLVRMALVSAKNRPNEKSINVTDLEFVVMLLGI